MLTIDDAHISAYVLMWQSPAMSAPAFWYYRTEAAAREAAATFQDDDRTAVRAVRVPADFRGWTA